MPDPIYNSILVTKFINGVMWAGKKSTAEKIFYGAMEKLAEKTGDEPLKVFKKALDNVAPTLEVKSRRIGGATYQVPMEVSPIRQMALAMRWIIDAARKRGKGDMKDHLASELIDAKNGRGNAVKKREDTHKMADANKAFAHFRF